MRALSLAKLFGRTSTRARPRRIARPFGETAWSFGVGEHCWEGRFLIGSRSRHYLECIPTAGNCPDRERPYPGDMGQVEHEIRGRMFGDYPTWSILCRDFEIDDGARYRYRARFGCWLVPFDTERAAIRTSSGRH